MSRGGQEADELIEITGKGPDAGLFEVTHSWFNRFRKLPVRYQKRTTTRMGALWCRLWRR